MKTPTMEIKATKHNGKKAIEVIVRNGANIGKELDALGILPDCTIANRRSRVCTSAEELDTVRAGLASMFDASGNYVGNE